MHFLSLERVLACLLLANTSCFTANADSASDALAQIPACGVGYSLQKKRSQLTVAQLQCIAENLPAIGCGLTDVECQCTSKNSTQILQPCLMKLCTFDETFGMCSKVRASDTTNVSADILRVQATLCDRPHNSLGNYIRVIAYVTGIIPIIAIAMRFASRRLGRHKLWWDDWLHLASVVSNGFSRLSYFTYRCARS
jgi:hypothetical protein